MLRLRYRINRTGAFTKAKENNTSTLYILDLSWFPRVGLGFLFRPFFVECIHLYCIPTTYAPDLSKFPSSVYYSHPHTHWMGMGKEMGRRFGYSCLDRLAFLFFFLFAPRPAVIGQAHR